MTFVRVCHFSASISCRFPFSRCSPRFASFASLIAVYIDSHHHSRCWMLALGSTSSCLQRLCSVNFYHRINVASSQLSADVQTLVVSLAYPYAIYCQTGIRNIAGFIWHSHIGHFYINVPRGFMQTYPQWRRRWWERATCRRLSRTSSALGEFIRILLLFLIRCMRNMYSVSCHAFNACIHKTKWLE